MKSETFPIYEYNGARSLIILHAKHINSFFKVWCKAKDHNVLLPNTEDPDYESLETLLRHVLNSSGGYLTWICKKLNLPDPKIRKVSDLDKILQEAPEYINQLLEKWKSQLVNVKEENFYTPSFTSKWGSEYCIDAMLEHAVMHPLRHEFQLITLLEQQS